MRNPDARQLPHDVLSPLPAGLGRRCGEGRKRRWEMRYMKKTLAEAEANMVKARAREFWVGLRAVADEATAAQAKKVWERAQSYSARTWAALTKAQRKAENAHSDLLMAKEEAQKAQRVYRETARMKRAVRIKAARDAKVWVAEAQQIANSVEALAATWIDARRRSAKPEKNAFDVVLLKVADSTKKIAVIKVVRELTGLPLKEAKDLVDKAPQSVKNGVPTEDAEQMKAKLEKEGATIELK
jgi:large subunit ribosomal protein L7/L12